MEEYIVISKTKLQEEIETLEDEKRKFNAAGDIVNYEICYGQITILQHYILLSKDLQPVLEDAFDKGCSFIACNSGMLPKKYTSETKQDYINNFKL